MAVQNANFRIRSISKLTTGPRALMFLVESYSQCRDVSPQFACWPRLAADAAGNKLCSWWASTRSVMERFLGTVS